MIPPEATGRIGNGLGIAREAQKEIFLITLREIVAIVKEGYFAAVHLVGDENDPIAFCLEGDFVFDARTLQVMHDHLAVYWREVVCEGRLPQSDRHRTADYMYGWQSWVFGQADRWPRYAPKLARCICLVLVQQNVTQGIVAEMDLYDQLQAYYPVMRKA